MDGVSALLADLGKATGTKAELESRGRPSLLDAKALQSHVRVPRRTSQISSIPTDGAAGAAPWDRLPVRALGSSRAPSMLSVTQSNLEERLGQGSVGLARKGSAEARDRWRNLGAIRPRQPSVLAPSIPSGQLPAGDGLAGSRRASRLSLVTRNVTHRDGSLRLTGSGSRFAQIVRQVAVPSWMHSSAGPSASSPAALGGAVAPGDIAADLLASIDASVESGSHRPAGRQQAAERHSDADDIVAMLEASLEARSQHSHPALAPKQTRNEVAAQDATEMDRLLSDGQSPAAPNAQHASQHQSPALLQSNGGSAGNNSIGHRSISSGPSMQQHQQQSWLSNAGGPSAQHATSGYQEAQHDSWRFEEPLHRRDQDAPALFYSPTDHRQHISALLQTDLLEPASLVDLKAAWSNRPSFEAAGSASIALRFAKEAGKLLQSLDAWEQSEEQATQAHTLKVQQCFGIPTEASWRYAALA